MAGLGHMSDVPGQHATKRALFLDRDGVINIDHGYVHTARAFQFTAGVFSLIRRFRRSGFTCIVVTNSAGIARGYFSEELFRNFSLWIADELKNAGAPVDAIYYCPHHPFAGIGPYRRECRCRKPFPGMLHRAAEEWEVDLSASVLVGDRHSDILAGQRAGIPHLFLYAPHAEMTVRGPLNSVQVRELSDIHVPLGSLKMSDH